MIYRHQMREFKCLHQSSHTRCRSEDIILISLSFPTCFHMAMIHAFFTDLSLSAAMSSVSITTSLFFIQSSCYFIGIITQSSHSQGHSDFYLSHYKIIFVLFFFFFCTLNIETSRRTLQLAR